VTPAAPIPAAGPAACSRLSGVTTGNYPGGLPGVSVTGGCTIPSGAEDETTRDRPIYCWKTLVMVNEIPAGLVTVRELRQALDKAHPDQVVIFALTNQDLASLEAPLHNGLGISFAVGVDRAGAEGPVFRLVPGQPRQPGARRPNGTGAGDT
jgi:hypothetical protein